MFAFLAIALNLAIPVPASAAKIPVTIQLTVEEVVAYTGESPSLRRCLGRMAKRGVDPRSIITFLRLPSDLDKRKEVQLLIEGLDERDFPLRICMHWNSRDRRYDCADPVPVTGAAERRDCFR
jgi:hypothetical protein